MSKKSKAKKIFLKVLCVLLCLIVAFIAIITAVSAIGDSINFKNARTFETVSYKNQLVPEKDENGYWYFTTDEDFKILHLTDVHLGGGFMSINKDKMTLNAVAAMVTAEKPDLVVVTGDITFPVPFQAGTMNNKIPSKMFAELMESLGVYWTMTMGNHDQELYSYYSIEKIGDLYESEDYEHCLFQKDLMILTAVVTIISM